MIEGKRATILYSVLVPGLKWTKLVGTKEVASDRYLLNARGRSSGGCPQHVSTTHNVSGRESLNQPQLAMSIAAITEFVCPDIARATRLDSSRTTRSG